MDSVYDSWVSFVEQVEILFKAQVKCKEIQILKKWCVC